jgi:hypothetical protein
MEMCLGPAMFCWPLTPALICVISPPAIKKASVCSAIDRDVSAADGGFFFAATVLCLPAITGP